MAFWRSSPSHSKHGKAQTTNFIINLNWHLECVYVFIRVHFFNYSFNIGRFHWQSQLMTKSLFNEFCSQFLGKTLILLVTGIIASVALR